jgi:hypothetical protein
MLGTLAAVRLFKPVNEVPDARRENLVRLRFVIPIPDRTVAVPEKEVAVQVCTDDGCLVLAPPRRVQGPPVSSTNQACDNQSPVAFPKPAALPQPSYGDVDRVRLVAHSA